MIPRHVSLPNDIDALKAWRLAHAAAEQQPKWRCMNTINLEAPAHVIGRIADHPATPSTNCCRGTSRRTFLRPRESRLHAEH